MVVALDNEPTHLIAAAATINNAAIHVSQNLYDNLIAFDYNAGEFVPMLATEWDWLDDLRLQFKLRDDVIAADGSKFTAHDVMYTFEVGVNGTNASFWNMVDLDTCEVVDDFTIILGTKRIYNTIDMVMAIHEAGSIISKSSVEAVGGLEAALRNPLVGTGMYTFVEWVDGSHITLTRNEEYWGQKGYWKTIEFVFIPDPNSRAMALMSGDVDAALNLTYDQVIGIENDPNLQIIQSYANGVSTIYLNCSQPPLDDVRVREAIYLLIDVDAAIEVVTGGTSTHTDTMISSLSPLYLPRPAGYVRKVDVDRAKQLLAEAGYANGLTFRIISNSLNRAVCELTQANLAVGGINLELDIMESAAFLQLLRSGQYEAAQASSFNHDPTRQLNRVDGRLTPTEAAGGAMYNNDELNVFIDMARSTDPVIRLEGYHRVQQYTRDNFLVMGMFEVIYYVGARKDLTNHTFNSSGWLCAGALRPA